MAILKSIHNSRQASDSRCSRKTIERIPERGFHSESSRKRRCHFIEQKKGVDLSLLAPHQISAGAVKNNIESFIGAIEIPVGAAGPLHIIGSDFEDSVIAPIAASEGALVASISRGAYAINLSGGVRTRFIKQRMNRVPVFHFSSMADADRFGSWCQSKLQSLKAIVRRYSCFAELVSITTRTIGRSASVNFSYQTGDAAGQNMTTTCTWHACQWLMNKWREETDIPIISHVIEGNGSCDKKVSFTNFLEGRGCEAVAECTIPASIFKRILKITPQQFYENFQRAQGHSSALGMIGFNINVSNLIAGIFTATGQDIACVHESSLAHLSIEVADDCLYACLQLPSLVIGTVGGGTKLPVQRTLLALLGCDGNGKVKRFAEIIAGFSLALELSTGSAIVGGQFALAHEKYGRNHPVDWMKQAELEETILPHFLSGFLGENTYQDLSVTQSHGFQVGDSILTELSKNNVKKFIGIFPYDLSFSSNGQRKTLKTMIKIKALDTEVQQIGVKMASTGSRELAENMRKFGLKTGFSNCHKKELALCQVSNKFFTDHMPTVYYTLRDDERELYMIISERIENAELADSTNDIRNWQKEHVIEVLQAAASFHSVWFDADHTVLEQEFHLEKRLTSKDYRAMRPLFSELLKNARNEFSEIINLHHFHSINKIIESIDEWTPVYCTLPATLIHNDFNPRNILFQNDGLRPKPYIYDWELACIALPQRDIIEFLCFVLPSQSRIGEFDEFIDHHRRQMEMICRRSFSQAEWMQGVRYSLYDFIITRLLFYLMAHTHKDYKFIDRVVNTSMNLLDELERELCTV